MWGGAPTLPPGTYWLIVLLTNDLGWYLCQSASCVVGERLRSFADGERLCGAGAFGRFALGAYFNCTPLRGVTMPSLFGLECAV